MLIYCVKINFFYRKVLTESDPGLEDAAIWTTAKLPTEEEKKPGYGGSYTPAPEDDSSPSSEGPVLSSEGGVDTPPGRRSTPTTTYIVSGTTGALNHTTTYIVSATIGALNLTMFLLILRTIWHCRRREEMQERRRLGMTDIQASMESMDSNQEMEVNSPCLGIEAMDSQREERAEVEPLNPPSVSDTAV